MKDFARCLAVYDHFGHEAALLRALRPGTPAPAEQLEVEVASLEVELEMRA